MAHAREVCGADDKFGACMRQRENRRVYARKIQNEITHTMHAGQERSEVSLKGSPFAMLIDASPVSRLFIYRSVEGRKKMRLMEKMLHKYAA